MAYTWSQPGHTLNTEEPITVAENYTFTDVSVLTSDTNSILNPVSIINCVAGTIMTFVTFAGQIMVFTVVAKDPRLRTPGNYFIVSLAVADMLISIVSMPVWTLFWTLGYWPFSQVLCDAWNVVDVVLSNVSIYTILFISVDRYFSLKNPLSYNIQRTSWRARIVLVGIWMACILIHGSVIVSTQMIYGLDRDPFDCEVYYLRSVHVTIAMSGVNVWGTVGCTFIIYMRVYFIAQGSAGTSMKAKSKGKLQQVESPRGTASVSLDSTSAETHDKQSESSINTQFGGGQLKTYNKSIEMRKSVKGREGSDGKQGKALRTIALLLVTFAVCWLPLSIILVVATLSPSSVGLWWLIGCYWLGYINSMINPLCYALGNPYFKETLQHICGCGNK